MLQNLLKERFNLTLHHETKELPVYELIIGKSGPRLDDAGEPSSEPRPPQPRRANDDGFVDFPPGFHNISAVTPIGRGAITARLSTMADLADNLRYFVQRIVVDKTGLTGKYDFRLGFSRVGLPVARPDAPDTGEDDLFKSIQTQLGLKLESKKDPVDCLVIDHVDKIPTDNRPLL